MAPCRRSGTDILLERVPIPPLEPRDATEHLCLCSPSGRGRINRAAVGVYLFGKQHP